MDGCPLWLGWRSDVDQCRPANYRQRHVPCLPKLRVEGPRSSTSILPDAVLLLRIPVYRRLLLAASLLWGSHALHDSFAVIRWRGAGIDYFTISMLWSEAVFAEVVVFVVVGPWLINRIGTNGSIALAIAAGVLRWSTPRSQSRRGSLPASSLCMG